MIKEVCKKCTGCSTCLNICPSNAIEWDENTSEKKVKINENCIDCHLCQKTCPVNDKRKSNDPIFKVARLKDEKLIKKSTSGGLFACVARYILKNEGIVYGSGFTSDYYEVKHMRIDNLNDLDKILKSKYVRSNMGNTYKKVKEDLENGLTVLFCGSPCQVAGLKKFLKKDYKKLYTTDIICHDYAPGKIWEKYVKSLEKKEKSKVTYVDFRYVNLKEPHKIMYIKFENGTVINEGLYNSTFGKVFYLGLSSNKSCTECKFNDFNNYSELTFGDAWGYKNEKYPRKNSLVLINNDKGKDLYEKIKDELIEFTDFDKKTLIENNYPLIYSTPKHYNHNKIDINCKDIDKEILYYLDEKNGLTFDEKGVAILNFHYDNYNFGASLVAYSLSKVVEKLGYNPYIINFDPFPELDTLSRYATLGLYNFRKNHLNLTPKFKTKEELNILNDYFNMFIVGSDQVWRKSITHDNFEAYFLDFAENKNKVAYGASFGKEYFEGDEIETELCKSHLSDFYAVSVRENQAKEICQNTFNIDSQVVIDPTMLLNKEDYEKLIEEEYEDKVDVAVYFLAKDNEIKLENGLIDKLYKNKKIVNIKGEYKDKPFGRIFVNNSMSKWLDGIRKAEYVITDSYHGLVFSLIFNKKVILVSKLVPSRFNTLKENLKGNLEKINFANIEDIKEIDIKLNYKEINENIKKYQTLSTEFLKNNLGADKIKKQDENLAHTYKILKDLNTECKKLKTKNQELEKKSDYLLNDIYRITGSKSWRITAPLRLVTRTLKYLKHNGIKRTIVKARMYICKKEK